MKTVKIARGIPLKIMVFDYGRGEFQSGRKWSGRIPVGENISFTVGENLRRGDSVGKKLDRGECRSGRISVGENLGRGEFLLVGKHAGLEDSVGKNQIFVLSVFCLVFFHCSLLLLFYF